MAPAPPPSLMGFGDEDRFVVITDGQPQMNVVLFWRDDIPADWQQLEETSRWQLREGRSIREIVRRTGLSRHTIRKYPASGVIEPRYPDRKSPGKPDPFADSLLGWLVGSTGLCPPAKPSNSTALRAGRSSVVSEASCKWPTSSSATAGPLCCERACPLQTHEMLFDAHNHALVALGDVAERGIYDTMKTAVDEVRRGKRRDVNKHFKAMAMVRALSVPSTGDN